MKLTPRDLRELVAIARAVAGDDPLVEGAGGAGDPPDPYCKWCARGLDNRAARFELAAHAPTCVWRKARRIALERPSGYVSRRQPRPAARPPRSTKPPLRAPRRSAA